MHIDPQNGADNGCNQKTTNRHLTPEARGTRIFSSRPKKRAALAIKVCHKFPSNNNLKEIYVAQIISTFHILLSIHSNLISVLLRWMQQRRYSLTMYIFFHFLHNVTWGDFWRNKLKFCNNFVGMSWIFKKKYRKSCFSRLTAFYTFTNP